MKFRLFTPLTAGATGAFSLAASTSAFGSVIAVPVPSDIATPVGLGSGAPIVSWDVNNDTVVDFQFVFRYYSGSSWQALMSASSTNNTLGSAAFTSTAMYARSYGAAASIAPGNPAFSGAGVISIILGSLYAGSLYGGFAGGGNLNTPRFAGFRFNSGGQTLYGYVQVAVNANGSVGTIDFISAAYESTPSTAIQTAAIPEPSSLAALAAGGLAALRLRRRPAKAA